MNIPSYGEEVPTGWVIRIYLLMCAGTATAITWSLRHHTIDVCVLGLITIFLWIVTICNWNTTIVSEREWHDYR